MTEVKELSNMNFAIVTMKLKGSTNLDTEGYLVGYKPLVEKDFEVIKTNDMYAWLYRKGSIHMFCAKYYYIARLSYGYKIDNTNLASFQNFADTEKEQAIAIGIVEKIMAGFTTDGLIKYNGLVDYEKFREIADDVKKDIELAETTNKSFYTRPPATYGHNHSRIDYPAYLSSAYTPKVSTTTSFKRTTTYDVTTALADMSSKIKEIESGIYTPPKLAEIPADDPKAMEIDNKSVDDDTDIENYMNGYGMGY